MYLQMFARVDKYLPHFIIHYQRTILIIKWNNLRMKAIVLIIIYIVSIQKKKIYCTFYKKGILARWVMFLTKVYWMIG